MNLLAKGIFDIHDLTADDILYILDFSQKIKTALQNKEIDKYKFGKNKDLLLASLFYENSTRTRASFEVAASRLGIGLTGFGSIEGSSVKKGESLAHTLDMFEEYMCDGIILRHPRDGSAKFASERVNIPIFNGGDGKKQHPTQTILDLFTIKEHQNRIDNLNIGLGGDLKYGRTAHTLVLALSLFKGNRISLYSPPNLKMPQQIIDFVRSKGTQVDIYESLSELIPKVDIFYQTRIQKERLPDLNEFAKAKKSSGITLDILKNRKSNFGLMHPLPIDKTNPGIAANLDSFDFSIYKKQAGNGVPTRMAQIALALNLLEGEYSKTTSNNDLKNQKFFKNIPVKEHAPKKEVSIRPIRKNGVAIDHLKPHTENILIKLLKIRERKDVYRCGTVRSISRPENIKGMLMIENRVLDEKELRIIATLSPNSRVNIIENSKVVSKIELSTPNLISNIDFLKCPNVGCITRDEYKEGVLPKFVKSSVNLIHCHYCDSIVSNEELFTG
jgi:aspartate carbamoyltransferase catalytic subunit